MILNREVLIERFRHLEVKTAIEMRDNQIEQIEPETFQGLFRLMTIDLSQNQIEEIDKYTFNGLTNLREIWLNNNQLKYIHPDTFNGLTSLRTIYLHENSFECKKLELNLEDSVQYITLKNGWHNDLVFPFLNFILNKTKKESNKPLKETPQISYNLQDIQQVIVTAEAAAAAVSVSTSDSSSFSNQTLNKPKLSNFVTKSIPKLRALNELSQTKTTITTTVPIEPEAIVDNKESSETNSSLIPRENQLIKPTNLDLALNETSIEKIEDEKSSKVKTPVSRFFREKPKLLKTPYSETKSTPSSNRASNSLLEEIIQFLTPTNFSSQSKRSSINLNLSKENLTNNKLTNSNTQETINTETKKTENTPSKSLSNRNSLIINVLASISNSLNSLREPTTVSGSLLVPAKTESTTEVLALSTPLTPSPPTPPPTPQTEIILNTTNSELSPLLKQTFLPLNEITSSNNTEPNTNMVDKVQVSNEKTNTVKTTPIKSEPEKETFSDKIEKELNKNEIKIKTKSNPDSKDIIQFIFRSAIFVSQMVSLILMTLIIHLNCSSHCSDELKQSDRISFVITTALFALFSFTILTFDVCLCFKEKSINNLFPIVNAFVIDAAWIGLFLAWIFLRSKLIQMLEKNEFESLDFNQNCLISAVAFALMATCLTIFAFGVNLYRIIKLCKYLKE